MPGLIMADSLSWLPVAMTKPRGFGIAPAGGNSSRSLTLRLLGVAFNPDGGLLATSSVDKTARIWDSASGQELLKVAHYATVFAVAFSPDGNRVATAGVDKTARIWALS